MLKWTVNYHKDEGAAEDNDDEDTDNKNNDLNDNNNSHIVENPVQVSSLPSPDRLSGQARTHSSGDKDRNGGSIQDRGSKETDAIRISNPGEGLERTSDQSLVKAEHRGVESHFSVGENQTSESNLSASDKRTRSSPCAENISKTDHTLSSDCAVSSSFTSSLSSESSSFSSSKLSLQSSSTVTKSGLSTCENSRTKDSKIRPEKPVLDRDERVEFNKPELPIKALTPSVPDNTSGTLLASTSSSTSSPSSSSSVTTPPLKQHHQSNMATALPDITKAVPGMDREALGPEVEWEEEDLTIAQVLDMDKFPCISFFEEKVREKNGQWEFLSAGLKIYSKQPVLFQMRSHKKQARARTIFKDPSGAFFEVGQTMLIPDDYKGWFELVPSDFSRATCFMSIAEMAKVMPRKFFTRSNFKGIRVEGEGEDQKYLERKVPAGSVLETRGTFTAKWKTSAETGTFKKKTKEYELQEVTYLKCVDHDKSELLVPLTQRGKFNAIYERGQLTQNAVYSMKDILSDLSLPIKVRLLFGKAPVVPCIFTGMLVIRSAAMDDAVVGSTILNTRNVLFEIPIHSPVKAKYQPSDEAFAEMASYKDAQKLCKKYAKMYSTMIKLSPDLDTDQKTIQHVPSDPSVMRQKDEALRALDLITDISLTGEPKDHLLDSDAASMGSEDQNIIPKGGTLSELTEYKSRESHTHV